jgi:uncharacterized protein YbaR (Trm112 family)
MDKTLLTILACPNCKGSLSYQKHKQELACPVCRIAYPVRDDIPVMLIEQARELALDEDI